MLMLRIRSSIKPRLKMLCHFSIMHPLIDACSVSVLVVGGKEFVVDREKLVPCPVVVSVPPLGEGVTCAIGGKKVSGKVELRPGRYICVYSRTDCVSQSLEFEVRIGEDLTLASPVKWEQSSAMSMFSEAFRSFNSGALEVAKRLSREIGTIEDASRRKEVEGLKQAIELREKLNQR